MPVLVRKINQAKWRQNDIVNGETVSADAVTNCIKTQGNTLSVWCVDNEESINDAVLAIVAGGDNFDAIDIAILKSERLAELGIDVVSTPGKTPIQSLVETHADLKQLDYLSLGKIANCIVECFKEDKVKRISKKDVKDVLQAAMTSQKLDVTLVSEKLRSRLLSIPLDVCPQCGKPI